MNDKELLELVLSLFRFVLSGKTPQADVLERLTPETVGECFRFSDRFDLAHLLCYALDKLERLPGEERYRKKLLEAYWRFERLTYEKKRIGDVLEQAHIDHVFLKTPVLQPFYPEPWLRPSVDVDVLVKNADHDRAMVLLCEKLGCTRGKRTVHDVELLLPNGFHAEVHFALEDENEELESALSFVWDTAVNVPGKTFEKQFSNEMFYFYYICHMLRHFRWGGVGIKPVMDIWLMDSLMEKNSTQVDVLLRENGLLTFSRTVSRLAAVWLADGRMDDSLLNLESFILSGNCYGAAANMVAFKQVQTGGRIRFLRWRLFSDRAAMEKRYPVLQKKPWLMPLCQLRRWWEFFTDGRWRGGLHELLHNRKPAREPMEKLMKELELL